MPELMLKKGNIELSNTSNIVGETIKVAGTEFLVELVGFETHFKRSGITFNNNIGIDITFNNDTTIRIPSECADRLAFCSNNMVFETNELAVTLMNGGGCMVFNNNGLNVSTTPSGASSPLSGSVLLSQSLRSIERMTQSEYDALAVKDENTLYIIAG